MLAQYEAEKGVPSEVGREGRGDLATIMPPYEQALERPIRNVLFGDLTRLLLIQVQKQKGSLVPPPLLIL
jgi:hypothetical protein